MSGDGSVGTPAPQVLGATAGVFILTLWLMRRIRALPGVEAAGSIDDLPFIDGSAQPLEREGYAEGSPNGKSVVHVRQITRGYLRAMRIPLLGGRDIVENDVDVLLVSRDAAKLVWGADDPIGRRARLPLLSKTVVRQVVGIVGDVKQRDLAKAFTPTVTLVIRTSLPPTTLARPIVAAIHAIDPEQPVENIRTMGGHRLETDVAAVQRTGARSLCGGGAAARLGRHLRRAFLHRARTQTPLTSAYLGGRAPEA